MFKEKILGQGWLTTSILAVLIIYYFIGMHYTQHHIGGIGLYRPNNAVGWIFASAIISLGLLKIASDRQVLISPTMKMIALVFIGLIIPYFYGQTDNLWKAADRFVAIAAGGLIIFSLQQFRFSEKQWMCILFSIVVAALLQSLFGWYQYFLAAPGAFGGNVPFGTFFQKNNIGTFVLTGFSLACLFLLRAPKLYSSQIYKICFSISLIFTLFAGFVLVMVFSRSTQLITLIVIICICIGLGISKVNNRGAVLLMIFGLTLSICFGMYVLATAEGNIDALIELNDTAEWDSDKMTGEPRRLIWGICWNMFLSSPLLGFGYGDFRWDFLKAQAEKFSTTGEYYSISISLPHNELIFWAIEGGVVPLLCIVCFGLWFVIRTFRKRGISAVFYLVCLVPVIIHSMVEYPFYQAVVHWVTFCGLIAFISSRQEIKRCYTIAAPVIMRSLAVIIFILVTTYMTLAIQSLYWLEKYSVTPKLELLSNIWYPVEHGDIVLSAHMLQRMNDVNKVWNEKELLEHVDWLRTTIIYDPKDYLYKYMIRVLKALGQEEKSEQFRIEGKYLFPPSDI